MNVKAVVFDYGKVICFPPSAENRAALLTLTGLPAETLDALDRKYRGEYDRGTYDCKTYYRTLLSGAGIFPDEKTLETIAQTDEEGWKHLDPGTLALMGDVKNAGAALGILSNMPHEFLSWLRVNVPRFDSLDAAVFSCEEGSIKPERRIYEVLRSRLGCKFGEIVFFDDIPANVGKAAELGIRAFLWKGSDAAREELRRFGGALARL